MFTNEKASMYRNHERNYTNNGNDYKKIKGGINLMKCINKYTSYKYSKLLGDQSWRYERFFFACLNEKKYKEALTVFLSYYFLKVTFNLKLGF